MTLDDLSADELVGAMAALAEGETLRAAIDRAWEAELVAAGRSPTRPIGRQKIAPIDRALTAAFVDAEEAILFSCCARAVFLARRPLA